MRTLLVALALAALPAARAEAQAVVVVNAANPAATITKDQLAKIYMKKVGKWEHGAAAAPVDLPDGPVRAAFAKDALGKSPTTLKAYWQQMVFAGKETPPAEKASDADVLAFVRGNPGAIGYVAAGTALGAGVKAITVQ